MAKAKAAAEKVFWLSWWDPPNGKKGEHLPESKRHLLTTWTTGFREGSSGDFDEASICARVEADTPEEAWKLVEVMYPGASGCQIRFEEEHEAGWYPDEDRFPNRRGSNHVG